MLLSDMLSELQSFEIIIKNSKSVYALLLKFNHVLNVSPSLDVKAVFCDTDVPWPTLLLQGIETLTVGAETADLVSTLCHRAACIHWNHAAKGRDR